MMKMQVVMNGLFFLALVFFSATTVLAQQSIWYGHQLNWVDHAPNPRFAIHDPGMPGEVVDDLVLDKMTGLIWLRNAGYPGYAVTWEEAIQLCRGIVAHGTYPDRTVGGWRLPTIEEISALLDVNNTDPALPSGHPFVNIYTLWYYWSNTTCEGYSDQAWYIAMSDGSLWFRYKTDTLHVWPVLGGSGYATGNW